MQTRMNQLSPRNMQIFQKIQKVLQWKMLQNTPQGDNAPKITTRTTSIISAATTNQFHNHNGKHTRFAPHMPNFNHGRPANSAFTHNTTRSYNSRNTTCSPINSYSNTHNPIPHYSHRLTPTPNSQQLPSPRHNLSRQHTNIHPPSNTPQYYHQNDQPIAEHEKPNLHDQFSFLLDKIVNLQHQIDSTAGENGSTRRRTQDYWR